MNLIHRTQGPTEIVPTIVGKVADFETVHYSHMLPSTSSQRPADSLLSVLTLEEEQIPYHIDNCPWMLTPDTVVQLWVPRGFDEPLVKGHNQDQPYHSVCALAVLTKGKPSTRWLPTSGYSFE